MPKGKMAEGTLENVMEGLSEENEMEEDQMEDQMEETNTPIFPRDIGGKTFYSAEELQSYVAQLDAIRTESRSALKEMGITLPSARKPSMRKQLSEAVASILNNNRDYFSEVFEMLSEVKEDTPIRVLFNKESRQFDYPAPSPDGTGTGSRKASPLMVDGVEYPSARAARDTLHPDMVGKSQNRVSIVSYLNRQGHELVE